MVKSKMYREQHDEIEVAMAELEGLLTPEGVAADVHGVRSRVAGFLGKVGVHLAMEDKALYPKLLDSADLKVRRTAERFVKELGGLSDQLNAYNAEWPNALVVERDPRRFIDETSDIFELLTRRIQKENDELHPLLDAS